MFTLGAFVFTGLAAIATAIGNIEKVSEFVYPKTPPNIEIKFVGYNSAETVLSVSPDWNDYGYSGFSKPLKLPLVVRNSGEVTAENVKISFVFGPSLSISDSSAAKVDHPVHVSDLLRVNGNEEVRTISVDRIAGSRSYEWLDENLELQFRMRERVGLPMVVNNVPIIKPMWIDFTNSKLGKLGAFPIEYTISADGIVDSTGELIVEIQGHTLDTIQSVDGGKTVSFELVESKVSPHFGPVESEIRKRVTFFVGSTNELATYFYSLDKLKPHMLVKYVLNEFTSRDDQWLEFTDEYGLMYIFVDRGKDFTLDEFFSDLDFVRRA